MPARWCCSSWSLLGVPQVVQKIQALSAGGGHGRTALWSYGPALVTVNGGGQHAVDAVMTGIIKAMTSETR